MDLKFFVETLSFTFLKVLFILAFSLTKAEEMKTSVMNTKLNSEKRGKSSLSKSAFCREVDEALIVPPKGRGQVT